MAGQRRSEPGRHGAGRRARGRGLAALVSLTLLVLAACSGDALAPGTDRPGGGFGPGTSGADGVSATLVGVWQSVVVIQVPGDLQTWTTTWRFDAEGTCRQTVVTESLAEGFPRTTERTCTWTTNGAQVTIDYIGGGALTFDFSFAGFSPDRLILDGFEYQRQA